MALLWVRVPQITGGSKTEKIYAYYGDTDAPTAADAPGTYDASQVLVLPFSDTGTPADLTAYKNNPTASTAVLTPASLIGGGAKFAGKESITVPASPSLRLMPNQGLTASAWVRIPQTQQSTILALSDQGRELAVGIDGDNVVARAAFGGAPVIVKAPAAISLNDWHHVAVTAAAGKLTLYVDGVPVGSAPVTLAEIGGNFTIGAENNARFLTGDVDEVEVSKVARSADWIKASARGQGMDANLVVYGADGQKEASGQASYFGVIAKNLTLDGWVVIGICMGMLVIAMLIMIFKAFFLSRVEKGNARFLRKFELLVGDPTLLDQPSKNGAEDAEMAEASESVAGAPTMSEVNSGKHEFGASTLYRLYHSGVRELNKRVAGSTVGAQHASGLSPQSIDAIRAAMDASMTRLQQTLSSNMVLLTIAISGGPFLGLLGTVVGVMITFAAIAIAGDVNVNAIAPGIAAALAATIAGLAVAIPALFGYNWLNSRIKNISADNRVFVDEFVTRVAEQHS